MNRPWIDHLFRAGIIVCVGAAVVAVLYVRRLDNRVAANLAPPEKTAETPVSTPAAPSKHTDMISPVEAEAGMKLTQVAVLITRDEGYRDRPYLDEGGAVTIGVGRSLSTNGLSLDELYTLAPNVDHRLLLSQALVKNGRIMLLTLQHADQVLPRALTEDDVHLLLVNDLREFVREAKTVFPEWDSIDPPRREAILDVLFNNGLPHFKKFEDFIADVKARDWEKAGDDLLLSEAARENIVRYFRNASVIRTGDARHFQLDQ